MFRQLLFARQRLYFMWWRSSARASRTSSETRRQNRILTACLCKSSSRWISCLMIATLRQIFTSRQSCALGTTFSQTSSSSPIRLLASSRSRGSSTRKGRSHQRRWISFYGWLKSTSHWKSSQHRQKKSLKTSSLSLRYGRRKTCKLRCWANLKSKTCIASWA